MDTRLDVGEVDVSLTLNDSSLSVDTVNARFLTWLADNCADYGFVIRYPSDKVSITGRNEPWHVRYVGDAAARFMTEHNLCLEEFVALYQ